jgi:hypothetical protein
MSRKTCERTVERNKTKPCSVQNCHLPRHYISQYCRKHHHRRSAYGSPTGRPVRKQEYAVERKLARAFIRRHRDHDAVVLCIARMDRLLANAEKRIAERIKTCGRFTPQKRDIEDGIAHQLHRLHVAEIAGRDLLGIVLGFHLWCCRHPRVIAAYGDEPYWFGVARAMLLATTLYRHEVTDYAKGTTYTTTTKLPARMLRELGRRVEWRTVDH